MTTRMFFQLVLSNMNTMVVVLRLVVVAGVVAGVEFVSVYRIRTSLIVTDSSYL